MDEKIMNEEMDHEEFLKEDNVPNSFVKLSEEELEDIDGGKFVIDFTLNRYCPYHRKRHPGIQKVVGGFKYKGTVYPTYFCPKCGRYFFVAKNGYFDSTAHRL